MQKTARITSLGAYLPEKRLTNHDLEALVETTDEWIVTRSGIVERRIAGENEFTSTMGIEAAKQALDRANIDPESIDAVILSTMTPDYLCPNTASLIANALNLKNACAFDINVACTGFVYGLQIAKAWIETNTYSNILLIASEKNSAFVDYTDRTTCVLFGDGAGAALIQGSGSGYTIGASVLGADGSLSDLIAIPASGCRAPCSQQTLDARQHYIKMNGKEVFKHAVRRMEQALLSCLEKNNVTEEKLAFLIPHQANIRIIEAVAKRFSIPNDHIVQTISKYANTSSSTIPIALEELHTSGIVHDNDTIALIAFGGGLTWGASLLTKETSL